MTTSNQPPQSGSSSSSASEEGAGTAEPTLAKRIADDEGQRLGRASSFSLDVERRSITDGLRGYVNKIRTGDPGALPSVLGLVVLGIIFSQVSDRFLSKGNIGALPGQGAYIALIALGLVFVLL